jgi:hypothetical protein
MLNKHQELIEQLIAATDDGEGFTDRALRNSVRIAVAAGRDLLEAGEGLIAADLRPYLQKVSRHAHKVTDGDIERLKAARYSEDAIFELTVSAAVGAGLGRLERGLAALRTARPRVREVHDALS